MRTRTETLAALLALALIPLAALGHPARGATYLVTPDGGGDYPTIQQAIDHASDGDTILLTDGIYQGAFNRDIRFWGKAISLRSQNDDPTACIIDCQATPEEPARGFTLSSGETEQTVIRGLTIQGGISPDT
ncbi:MAG: hypothetical protein GF330_13490 [Candidatus Eisenbacteria bacterium]|nr:hypothetical protein [Candidatus Eisenbacteria bacterium]